MFVHLMNEAVHVWIPSALIASGLVALVYR